MRVVEVSREETYNEAVPTGRKARRFKDGWRLENGELFRRPTINDIDEQSMPEFQPHSLPQWVLDRIPAQQ